MLRRCIQGMSRMDTELQFIIHDNGSNDASTIETINQLEASGITVYRYDTINRPADLNRANESVQKFFSSQRLQPSKYAVTDCDIDMSIARADSIDIYAKLLDLHDDIGCAGPMLRIHNIPKTYPLYNRVMNRHIHQFWSKKPTWMRIDSERIATQECLIDTTFALHRAGEDFRRLKRALRVYEPFEALHLDWYVDSITSENSYCTTSGDRISHWNNYKHFCEHQNDALEHTEYIRVEIGIDGQPREVLERIA
jgi:hypothetical protein